MKGRLKLMYTYSLIYVHLCENNKLREEVAVFGQICQETCVNQNNKRHFKQGETCAIKGVGCRAEGCTLQSSTQCGVSQGMSSQTILLSVKAANLKVLSPELFGEKSLYIKKGVVA